MIIFSGDDREILQIFFFKENDRIEETLETLYCTHNQDSPSAVMLKVIPTDQNVLLMYLSKLWIKNITIGTLA